MRFEGGNLVVGKLAGIPIRLHWSTPLAFIIVGGFAFRPVLWAVTLGLILVHELGHAFVVRLVGARVVAVDVGGYGGLCHWRGDPGAVARALIAWGGVFAQLALWAAATAALLAWTPATSWQWEIAFALTTGNLRLAAINLLPIPPLDGSKAWPLFPALLTAFRRRRNAEAMAKQVVADITARAKNDRWGN
jgi:stage IV sporulation protein FB